MIEVLKNEKLSVLTGFYQERLFQFYCEYNYLDVE